LADEERGLLFVDHVNLKPKEVDPPKKDRAQAGKLKAAATTTKKIPRTKSQVWVEVPSTK
jgi:hypothetical protein